jgi:hypothetical protein
MVQVLRVVVASPGDVAAERGIVDSVALELNRTVAADRKVRLEVARWETDAYPGFHVEGPQGICDRVLRIEDCDLLVGIFWTRFGKPTPDGMTGTEHEIHKAISSWQNKSSPHVMVFFNSAAPNLRSGPERRQWALVAEYRERFPADGLVWEYDGAPRFEHEFRKCLSNYLRERFPTLGPGGELHSATGASPGGPGAAASNHKWTKLLIDRRIPGAQVPAILTAFADFVRACGGIGIEAKLTAEPKKRKGEKNA